MKLTVRDTKEESGRYVSVRMEQKEGKGREGQRKEAVPQTHYNPLTVTPIGFLQLPLNYEEMTGYILQSELFAIVCHIIFHHQLQSVF